MIRIKLLSLLLVTVMLLSACANSNSGETESTTPSTSQTQSTTITTRPTEPPIPTVDEVIDCTYETEGGTNAFAQFVHPTYDINKISVTRTSPDGTTTVMNLARQGNEGFVYKAGDTTLSFRYLVYCIYPGTDTDNFDYLEYVLMANDTNATYLDTLNKENPSAVVIYAEYQDFTGELAEKYGTIPEGVQNLTSLDPYYLARTRSALETTFFIQDTDYNTHRYDYEGNLLFSTEDDLEKFRELPDGGFIAALNTPCPTELSPALQYASIVRYDKNGSQIWKYTPVNEAGEYSLTGGGALVKDIQYHNDQIYVFTDTSDIYILSTDGKLLSYKDHHNMPSFRRIVPTEEGFTVSGTGYAEYTGIPAPAGESGSFNYVATMDFDGNIVEVSYPDELNSNAIEAGVLGQVIYRDNPIFTPTEGDKLPDKEYTESIAAYDTEDGYVLIRIHDLDKNCDMYVHGGLQDTPYSELIFTGYDKNGTPLWQTTSPVFGPLTNHFWAE